MIPRYIYIYCLFVGCSKIHIKVNVIVKHVQHNNWDYQCFLISSGELVRFFNIWEPEKNSWVVVFRDNQYPAWLTMAWVNSIQNPTSQCFAWCGKVAILHCKRSDAIINNLFDFPSLGGGGAADKKPHTAYILKERVITKFCNEKLCRYNPSQSFLLTCPSNNICKKWHIIQHRIGSYSQLFSPGIFSS